METKFNEIIEEEIGNQDESFYVDVETKFNEIIEEELDNKRESNNDDVKTIMFSVKYKQTLYSIFHYQYYSINTYGNINIK